jgi:hypothetical protein
MHGRTPGRCGLGVIVKDVGMEAAIEILFAADGGFGKELSRNWRLCRRLNSKCRLIVGDLEARLGCRFLEIFEALLGGAGLVLAIGCNQVRQRLRAVSTAAYCLRVLSLT